MDKMSTVNDLLVYQHLQYINLKKDITNLIDQKRVFLDLKKMFDNILINKLECYGVKSNVFN